MHTKSQKI